MTDMEAIALAIACFVGALVPMHLPIVPVLIGALCALATRKPAIIIAFAVVLSGSAAAHAWDRIDAPMAADLDDSATVVTDPERKGPSTSALIKVDGRNLVASAWGPNAARLAKAQAGDRLQVKGSVSRWNASRERHAALATTHRVTIAQLTVEPAQSPMWRTANALRESIARGSASLGDARGALFSGLVYGDDRGQDPVTAADFRLAGLTHLLAVSGQNVAYVLVLLRPALVRFGYRARWLATLAALLVFAAATRFEPSVLRATVMAAIAATGGVLGRETSSIRTLALAVGGLVLFNPLLASTVAFRLSVAASAGILVGRQRLANRLGGGLLAQAAAVTLSAQLAVAPLLVSTFGPVSVMSLPANIAAGPAAGLVMVWGMTCGVVAGVAGGAIATSIHRPTTVALWWLETVARAAAAVPIAPVGLTWLAGAVAVFVVATRPRRWSISRRITIAIGVLTLCSRLVPSVDDGLHPIGPGSHLVVSGTASVLVIDGRPDAVWALEDLRRIGVREIDLAVIASDRGRDDLDDINSRVPIAEVLVATDQTESVRIIGGRTVHIRGLPLSVVIR